MLQGGLEEEALPGDAAPAIGLVLGAGGVVGQAYQVGVLAALEREAGWDPREAAIIVGTSAGSVTGTASRSRRPTCASRCGRRSRARPRAWAGT